MDSCDHCRCQIGIIQVRCDQAQSSEEFGNIVTRFVRSREERRNLVFLPHAIASVTLIDQGGRAKIKTFATAIHALILQSLSSSSRRGPA